MGPPTTGVRKGHELDVSKVLPLLAEAGAIPSATAACEVSQFSHGQSNPTYLLDVGGQRLVLRKQPPGKLLRGAHAVDREYTAMSALQSTAVPVPATRLFVHDTDVLGTPFLVCDYVSGRFFKDPSMRAAPSAEERARLYGGFMRAVAALHTVDYDACGLGAYGKVGGYTARQTKVWTSQFRAAETEPMGAMEKLIAWLPEALPADDDLTTLVHGDLRVDNMIFDPHTPDVRAVLDWELSTLGHPATDLALVTLPYDTSPKMPSALSGFGKERAAMGIPSEYELIGAYVEATGLASVAHHLDYYRAFACFRMASILQGVYKRSLSGQASSADGAAIGKLASVVADLGLAAADRYTTTPDRLTKEAGLGAAFAATLFSTPPTPTPTPTPASSASPVSAYALEVRERVRDFVNEKVLPVEHAVLHRSYEGGPERWTELAPEMEHLKQQAKDAGLWNLFMPSLSGLSNEEYAGCAEEMGRSLIASEAFNCQAPDTGNMEVLHMFGTPAQQEKWLTPLLNGDIRSCFAMTEPAVASSDATNMQATVLADGDELVLNGVKWWTSNAGHPNCNIGIFMGRVQTGHGKDADEALPRHRRHSMVLVPMDTPGVTVLRPLRTMGYDDAPHGHCEVAFENVRVPADHIVLGSGRGFEIAQARLGPGRVHHCMRLIGMAERCLDLACARADHRAPFGKPLSSQGVVMQQIAQSRVQIEQARLLTLQTARMIDEKGAKAARQEIAMIKAVAPQMAQDVIDRCMQIHGGMGMSNDTPMAHMFVWARNLRLADGPDEVHLAAIAKAELKAARQRRGE